MKEGHRAHEWTELFFDLIFVAALVKLSVLLKQGTHARASEIILLHEHKITLETAAASG